MPRHYIIQDWQNAAEYSGQMIGKRLARSKELFLPNGQANTALFTDEEEKPKKQQKKKSVADSIDLANRHYERMEKMSLDLDDEYALGEMEEERYLLLRSKMDERLTKAWVRLEKENALHQPKTLVESFSDDDRYHRKGWSVNASNQAVNRCKNSLFDSLSDDNIFKKLHLTIEVMRGIWK